MSNVTILNRTSTVIVQQAGVALPVLNKLTTADVFSDFVVSGLLSPTSASLTSILPAGVAYVTGMRTAVVATPSTYAPSSDTYDDLASSGIITHVAVANGASAPPVTANNLRLQKVVSSGTAITAVVATAPIGQRTFDVAGAAAAAQAAAIAAAQPVYAATNYGLACNGTTDDTAALNALLALVYAAGGGQIVFPPSSASNPAGTLLAGQIIIPNDGQTVPTQPSIRLSGSGATAAGQGTARGRGGSVLTMTYAGAGAAKLVTYGTGLLEIDHLVFLETTATTTTPFIFTSNTTLRAHDNTFYGAMGHTGIQCLQDVFVFGGTGSAPTGDATGWFQGYGTVIRDNFADYIRRFALLQSAANNIVIEGNTIWGHSGSALVNGAAIHVARVGVGSKGTYIAGNLVEVSGYPYAYSIQGNQHTLFGNGTWDVGHGVGTNATTLGAYFTDGGGNILIDGNNDFNASNPYTGWTTSNIVFGTVLGAAFNWVPFLQVGVIKLSTVTDYNSHTLISTIAPTISSGFGTGPTVKGLLTCAFSITVGSAPGSTGVIALSGASANTFVAYGWACSANNVTNNAIATVSKSAGTLTSVTLTNYSRTTGLAANFTAGDVIEVQCMGY